MFDGYGDDGVQEDGVMTLEVGRGTDAIDGTEATQRYSAFPV